MEKGWRRGLDADDKCDYRGAAVRSRSTAGSTTRTRRPAKTPESRSDSLHSASRADCCPGKGVSKGGSSHRARERNVPNCQRYAAATPSFFLSPLNASLPAQNRASGTRQIHRTSADEICTIGLGMSQCCRRAGAGLNTICKVPSPASDTFAKQMAPEIHCIPASSPASSIGRPATGKQKKENGPENTAKTRGKRKISN